jgi:hypothetical protein
VNGRKTYEYDTCPLVESMAKATRPAKLKPAETTTYCLYCETDKYCSCIRTVTDKTILKMRIENQLAIYRILWKPADETERAEIQPKAEKLKERLQNLCQEEQTI